MACGVGQGSGGDTALKEVQTERNRLVQELNLLRPRSVSTQSFSPRLHPPSLPPPLPHCLPPPQPSLPPPPPSLTPLSRSPYASALTESLPRGSYSPLLFRLLGVALRQYTLCQYVVSSPYACGSRSLGSLVTIHVLSRRHTHVTIHMSPYTCHLLSRHHTLGSLVNVHALSRRHRSLVSTHMSLHLKKRVSLSRQCPYALLSMSLSLQVTRLSRQGEVRWSLVKVQVPCQGSLVQERWGRPGGDSRGESRVSWRREPGGETQQERAGRR